MTIKTEGLFLLLISEHLTWLRGDEGGLFSSLTSGILET